MIWTLGGIACVIVAVVWYMDWTPKASPSTTDTLDEHATIKALIKQASSEKVKALLRDVGKALYDADSDAK